VTTARDALTFVRKHGIVLESAHGPVPNLAEAVAGAPIRGSWWGHRKGHEIFRLTRAVRASPEVLVCRLVDGMITYVHRRMWPALVRLSDRFERKDLAAVHEMHMRRGHHEARVIAFGRWLPARVKRQAHKLTEAKAVRAFGEDLLSTLR